MKKSNQMNSMRRKVLEDTKPERDAAAQAEAQQQTLDSMDLSLKDILAGTELTGEAIEQQGKNLIESIDKVNTNVLDTTAASELVAETIELQTNKLESIGDTLSQKLSTLVSMLEARYGQPETISPTSPVEEALPPEPIVPDPEVIRDDVLPPVEDNDPNEQIIPDAPRSDPDNNNDTESASDAAERETLSAKLDDLIKVTKSGFKGAIGVSDKISNMLFKYTITAVAAAAKTAAMIFAIVAAIDIIKANFDYWSKKLQEDFKGFFDEAKEWAPVLKSIIDMVENIEKAFNEGDAFGIAKAVAEGLVGFTKSLADIITLGLVKLTATIMRMIPGLEDKADDFEGSYLKGYQERNGSVMSKDDQQTIAKYEDNYLRKKYKNETYNKVKDLSPESLEQARKYGSVDEDTVKAVQTGEAPKDPLANLSDQERLDIIAKRNEAQAEITRTSRRAEELRNQGKDDSSIQSSLKSIEERLNDPLFNKSPEIKAVLNNQSDELKKQLAAPVKPADVDTKEDVKTTKRLQELEKAKDAPKDNKPTQTTNVAQVNSVQNRTMYNMPPTTGIPAPGMYRSFDSL